VRARRALTRPPARPLNRILILGHGAVGDTLFFLPVVETLRRERPKARLVWLSNPSWVSKELIPATGLCDEVWLWNDADPAADRKEIGRRIKEADFDAAVLTMTAPAGYFQCALSGIPTVAAHVYPGLHPKRALVVAAPSRLALGGNTETVLGQEHTAVRNLKLLAALGLPVPEPCKPRLPIGDRDRARAKELAPNEGPLIVVHPGRLDNYNNRDWAPEKFGALCSILSQSWPDARFVLIGSPEESPAALRVRAAFHDAVDLVGRLSLIESYALVERADLLISCDTGPSKAAYVLGTPSVVLWGPSSTTESGKLWDPERHLELSLQVECAPCSFSGMPRDGRLNYSSCGHHKCLRDMTPEWVAERVRARWPRPEKLK
jgi:ADP-heptose:LPS heptosyltransferase